MEEEAEKTLKAERDLMGTKRVRDVALACFLHQFFLVGVRANSSVGIVGKYLAENRHEIFLNLLMSFSADCSAKLSTGAKTQKPKGAGEEEAGVPSPLQSSAWGKNGQPVPRWNHLDNFHKRYNKVGKS